MARTKNNSEEQLYRQVLPYSFRKGDLRKLEIIESTMTCLSKVGYTKLSLGAIADACRMKRQHVAYHFRDLDEVIEATLRYCFATGQGVMADFLKEPQGLEARLSAYIDGFFFWLEKYPSHQAVVSLLSYLGTVDKRYREMSKKMREVGCERLLAMLHAELDGKDRVHYPARAKALHSYIMGEILIWLTCTDSKRAQNKSSILRTMLLIANGGTRE